MPTKELKSILLDTDVIINWLIKETETVTKKALWKTPLEIISRIESKQLKCFISLATLLEIRFFLRRKKKVSESQVSSDVQRLMELFEVIVPDEIELLRANKLQSEYPLDPFDSILLSLALGISNVILVSRDADFLKIAGRLVEATTPEDSLILLSET